MKVGICGTMESNDCLISVSENSELVIEIDSIVGDFFYDKIKKLITDDLEKRKINNIKVKVVDKGALDFTIKARLSTALDRMEN